MIKKKLMILTFMFFTCLRVALAGEINDGLKEAQTLSEKGHKNAAIATYLRLMKEYPDNPRVIRAFADFMLEKKDYGYALRQYEKYLELKPDDMKVRRLLIGLYQALDLSDSAVNECKEFLEYEPENLEILGIMQKIYTSEKEIEKAMLVTEQLLKHKPDDVKTRKEMLELYVLNYEYQKAAVMLDKWDADRFPPYLVGAVYLNAYKYDKAIQIFNMLYKENPSEENRELLERAKLAKATYELQTSPRNFGGYFNPLRRLHDDFPGDRVRNELFGYLQKEVTGVYPDYDFTVGKSGDNEYIRHTGRIYYPVLSTGTELIGYGHHTRVRNDNNTGYYKQTGLEVNQALGRKFKIGGAIGAGEPGTTYKGQVHFNYENVNAIISGGKNYQIQTPEAIERKISYKGLNYYGAWQFIERLQAFGRYSRFDYSDNNQIDYWEYGLNYRLWESGRNSFVDLSTYRTSERFKFTSPYYSSPTDLNAWYAGMELGYYLDSNSLLKISYSHTWESQNNNYSVYSGYIDRRFTEDIFIYGEFVRSASRLGRIAHLGQSNEDDYEMKIGVKFRF